MTRRFRLKVKVAIASGFYPYLMGRTARFPHSGAGESNVLLWEDLELNLM